MTASWSVTPDNHWLIDIWLPYIGGQQCNTIHASPSRYTCTRAAGHTGRHAATGSPALGHKECPLYAVWSTP